MKSKKMSQEFENSTNDIIKHIEQMHLSYIEVQSKSIRGKLSKYT